MTAGDILARRDRVVSVSKRGRLRVVPRSGLTDVERAWLAEPANAALVVAALPATALVDSLMASQPTPEDELERRTRAVVEGSSRHAVFTTQRGRLMLEELSDAEARGLAARGKLSEDEVRRWHAWRERRLRFPREARYALFLLRARRSGVSSLAVYYDGRVVLS